MKSVLDRAAEEGANPMIETAALAHVPGHLARDLARPEVREVIAEPPRRTAAEILQIIVRGLAGN
jgi:predicted HD phosphohydrolase